MSDTVAEAAVTACAAPIPGSGPFMDSGVGNSKITMLSQNAARMRKNMTLPCVLHGIFTAVEVTLAGAFEGEVRSVLSILRMFEESFRRPFLKFERFSSLRKTMPPARHYACPFTGPAKPSSKAEQGSKYALSGACLRAAFVRQQTVHHSRRIQSSLLVISRHPR